MVWGIILGRWGLVGVGGALFLVGGGSKIIWVGGVEWQWVCCLTMPW